MSFHTGKVAIIGRIDMDYSRNDHLLLSHILDISPKKSRLSANKGVEIHHRLGRSIRK